MGFINIPRLGNNGNIINNDRNRGGDKPIIINGRRMSYQGGGVHGGDLIRESRAGNGRRPIIRNGLESRTINPDQFYSDSDLMDKHGRPVQIQSMPDRTKGAIRYGEPRTELSRAVITDQVHHLAANFFKHGVEFDDNNSDWLLIPRYRLPRIWDHRETPLLIVFPTDYPEIPPVGFYLQETLSISPNGHFYKAAYHDACKEPIDHGWKWYCTFVKPGSWMPAPIQQIGDWRRGDNLWTYFNLIGEVLGSPDE